MKGGHYLQKELYEQRQGHDTCMSVCTCVCLRARNLVWLEDNAWRERNGRYITSEKPCHIGPWSPIERTTLSQGLWGRVKGIKQEGCGQTLESRQTQASEWKLDERNLGVRKWQGIVSRVERLLFGLTWL